MIRVVVTYPLDAEALEQLNEIPEFEVHETAGFSPEEMRREIVQADALVCGGSPPSTAAAIATAAGLKLIISIGAPDAINEATAKQKGIEVRPVEGGKAAAAAAIAILREFFNA